MKNLLLLHGALGYGGQFDAIKPLLKDNFNIYTPTFSGHGGGDVPSSLSIQGLAEQVIHYIKENIVGEVNVFGHSMGGYVALYVAANNLVPIHKLMTLGTKQLWSPEIAKGEARMLNTEKLKEKVPAFAKHLEKIHGSNWELLCQKIADMLLDMGDNPPLTDASYKKIEIPVQLSIGDNDKMVSLEETIEVFRKLSKARLLVMPNTPHPYEQVNPERIAYKINSYFG